MIFDLKYTSAQGNTLNLTDNADFFLKDVDGLTAADVDLSTVTIALADGDEVTNTKGKARSINLYLEFKQGVNVELAKRRILAAIKPKNRGRLDFTYQGLHLQIEGVTQAITIPRFSNDVIMQITIYCGFPYWKDATKIISEISTILDNFHFEMTVTTSNPIIFGKILGQAMNVINNSGDVPTGMMIHIIAMSDNVINPKIERTIDGAFFVINTTMNTGDEIIINTNKGQKDVLKNGTSIINLVGSGSTWFQLEVGENEFTVTDQSGNNSLITNFEYKRAFI